MKNNFLKLKFLLFCWLLITSVSAQKVKNCDNNCFQTNILSIEAEDEDCTRVELEITFSGACESDLSHYTVSVPSCTSIHSVSNSENWKQELNITDPTSGLSGFKIDDIPHFGNTKNGNSPYSFIVSFVLCTSDNSCRAELNCWAPTVAYKAGQCVFYETPEIQCNILEAIISKQDLSCFESGDGSIAVEILDGVEPYQFEWSTGATSQQVTGLAAGHYSVVITDASEQQITLETTLVQPDEMIVTGSITNSTCKGNNNGAIDVIVSGGEEPYSFLWSNSSTDKDLEAVAGGTYYLNVTDGSGCTLTMDFQVGIETAIDITGIVSNATCTSANGSIDITVTGGNQPYAFHWSNEQDTEDIENLASGNYTVIVTDAAGCQASKTFSVGTINTLRLIAQVTKTGCQEDESGAIYLTVTGGTEPYTFEWSNGETTEDLSNLKAGYYQVWVTDALGCSRSLLLVVTADKLLVSSDVTAPGCFGDSDGAISITPLSGEAPYSYLWSNGETGSEISNLSSGFYSVTITDATGCSSAYNYFLSQPSALTGSYTVSNSDCNAEGFYNIDLSVSGGKLPYTYDWSNGEVTQDLSSLHSGEYKVVVTDANHCTWEQVITIEGNPSDLTCLIENPTPDIRCNTAGNLLNATATDADSYNWHINSTDGSWLITAGGATPQLTYTSGNAGSSATITLTIQKDGCTKSCSIELEGCAGDNESDCGDNFSTKINLLSVENGCYYYEAIVSYNGDHRRGLSHFTIDIPCGNITELSNSRGWKNVIGGTDPTTGLWGIKIDDINGFGEGSQPDSFVVNFTICHATAECQEIMDNWHPIVAYKAGQCVAYDTIQVNRQQQRTIIRTLAYPNPFVDKLTIEMDINEESFARLDILGYHGELVKAVYNGKVEKGATYPFVIDTSTWPEGFYYFKLNLDGKVKVERILLSR